MGFTSALERRSSPENPATSLSMPAAWLYDALGGSVGKTGVVVNEQTAMQSTAVYACNRVLSETMAYLPLQVYERVGENGKKKALAHPNYELLHDRPNPELTSFAFRELLQMHLGLWGNSWAEKEIDGNGKICALWPLMPNRTKARRINGVRVVETQLPDGQDIRLPSNRVMQIAGMGFNGLMGFSPIRMAMSAIGLSIATEEFGSRFFGQGATMAGVLTHPETLSEPAQIRIRKSFDEVHSGLSNAHRVMILEEGMKYEKIGIPPEEAQFLQIRKFQHSEICRIYRVPPHMAGDLDRPFQSNVEQMGLDFIRYAVGPWLERWEQVLNWDLFSTKERRQFFAEFNVKGLLRGDLAAQTAHYQAMFNIGVYSQNDIRENENLNPVEDGDERFVPLNVQTLSQAIQEPVEPAVADPTAPPARRLEGGSERARQNGLALRRRVQSSHRRLFMDAGTRIVRREVEAGKRAAKKAAGPAFVMEFRKWMDGFYTEHRDYITTQAGPAVEAMGAAIWEAASAEVGGSTDVIPQAETFFREFTDALAAGYVGRSQGQLDALLDVHGTPDEIRQSVEMRLGEWLDTRAAKMASWETVKLGSAAPGAAWRTAGRLNWRWATSPGSCNICVEMNGRVRGIGEAFVEQGEKIGDTTFQSRRRIAHAPLHEGCTCGVVPA